MNYLLKPSLKHIVLIKLSAILWNQHDMKNLLEKFCVPSSYTDFKSEWVKIETKAEKKVALLPLPKIMKEKILCFIRPVGFQIVRWKQFLDKGCKLQVQLPNEFSWTPQGTIDRKKTAEVMIEDKNIDIIARYIIACIFCLEDDILKLWKNIPKCQRKIFYSQEHSIELVLFWIFYINGQVHEMNRMIEERMEHRCSPYQYAFELAASNGYRVATEFFFQKLTAAEREESLVKTAASVSFLHEDLVNQDTGYLREAYSHILYYLMSQADEQQQTKVLECHPSQVLVCFLDWPLQNFFMETAIRMWKFLPKIFYQQLFIHFIGYVIEGYKDYNYQKLFREFWEQSPKDYKRYVFSGNISSIVSKLFKIRDEDNIRLIFQDATLEDKKSIIYHHDLLSVCKELLHDNQKDLLKYFIKECLPSKDEVVEFKNYYILNVQLDEFLLRKFLHVCEDIVKKRKSEEDERSKAKRECGIQGQ